MSLLVLSGFVLGLSLTSEPAGAEWKIDLSRRQKSVRAADVRQDVAVPTVAEKGLFDAFFESGEPLQELVILNTEKGFLPSTLRMRKGGNYLIHIVNVNEKEKNVSFVLDAFSAHHGTFFGQVKSFKVEPKKEGVYSFQCPETSAEGRVVVFAPSGTGDVPIRAPSSEASP